MKLCHDYNGVGDPYGSMNGQHSAVNWNIYILFKLYFSFCYPNKIWVGILTWHAKVGDNDCDEAVLVQVKLNSLL